MKPSLFDVKSLLRNSIHVKEFEAKSLSDQLHFHNAYEIALITKGKGRRIVGDSVDRFTDGDLTLMPPYLPHATYTESKHHIENNDESIHAIVVYFLPDWFQSQHFNAVEFAAIRNLFVQLKRGIKITGTTYKKISALLFQILHAAPGFNSIIILLQIIQELSYVKEFDYLSSSFYSFNDNDENIEKINKIYRYVMENFTNKIALDDVSEIAFMTSPAFCKYFKQKTNKTFTNFVNEIRIGYACELLINGNNDISNISFLSGFNNFTSFNKNFKKFTKVTPSEYRVRLNQIKENSTNMAN